MAPKKKGKKAKDEEEPASTEVEDEETKADEGKQSKKGKKGKKKGKKDKKEEEDDDPSKPKMSKNAKTKRKRAAKQIGRLVVSWGLRRRQRKQFMSMQGMLALNSHLLRIAIRVGGESGMGAKNLCTAENEIRSFRDWCH